MVSDRFTQDGPKYCFAIATRSDFPDFSVMKNCGIICCESVTDEENLKYVMFTTEIKTTVSMFRHVLSQLNIVPHKLPDHPIINTFGKGKSKRHSIFYRKIRSRFYRSSYQIAWKRRSDSKAASMPMPVRQKHMGDAKVSDTESEDDDVVIDQPKIPSLQSKLSDFLPKLPVAASDLARENERLKDVLAERERYVATLEAQLALRDKQLKALAATL